MWVHRAEGGAYRRNGAWGAKRKIAKAMEMHDVQKEREGKEGKQ